MDFRLVGITLKEALDIAYESDSDVQIGDIYIEPPDSHALTDEDSGDDEEGGLVDNLTSRQLSAEAEIRFTNNRRVGGVAEELVKDFSDAQAVDTSVDTPTTSKIAAKKSLTLDSKPSMYSFCEMGDLESPKYPFPQGDYTNYSQLTNVELFELFFTHELLEEIVQQTRNYAVFNNCADPKISVEEVKVFLAILILSGYNRLPSKRSYWETEKDMRNEMVFEAMRRDRFLQICRFIHFADNNKIDKEDKMYKLRFLTDSLKAKFLAHFVPEQNLSYDESMIRYYGRHGCKQFIRGKPIRFGYKVWSLNTPSGYMVNFEIYQGKNPRANNTYEQLVGKAAVPLLQMMEDLDANKRVHRYNLFFDNLFTGVNLLCTLKANGYGATGTVRENRVPRDCPIMAKKIIMKKLRGTYSTVLEKNTGIQFIRWMDNSVATIASTSFGVSPLKNVDRYSRKDKKTIPISRPDAFLQYNKNMGGTDQMDENVSNYRVGIRSKKWYWPIFTYLVDVSIHNAWQLRKKSGQPISQLEFKRSIAQTYLRRYKNLPKGNGRTAKHPGDNTRVADDIRLDNMAHYVIPVPDGKRKRCAGNNCSSRGRTMCDKCQVGLCVECFKGFHTK